MPSPPSHPPGVFDVLSRTAYWSGVGAVMAVLIVLSIVGGLYNIEIVEMEVDPTAPGPTSPGMEHRDPLSAFLFSRVGLVVILGLFQFFAANLLFLAGAWLVLRVRRALESRRIDESDAAR